MLKLYFWQHVLIGIFAILGADYSRFLITEMLMKMM